MLTIAAPAYTHSAQLYPAARSGSSEIIDSMTNGNQVKSSDSSGPLFFWGVDVGGTNIKLGLVDDAGETVAFEEIPTREPDGPQGAIERTAETIRKIEQEQGLDPRHVPYVGLGTPGSMDLPTGMLIEPPNLPHWFHFPIRDALSTAIERPVAFLNDANAAAYGEFWRGVGRDFDDMILLTLGTGVGGGIVVDHELVNGRNSFGSECGHIIVNSAPDARLCVWGGGRGHLEAYASASAVVARTRDRLNDGAESSLADVLKGGDGKLTARQVYLAAEREDSLALEIVDETAWWLAIGITTLVHTIDPGLVVLGGAMDFGGRESAVGRRFLDGIRREFQDRTWDNVFAGTTIDFASLGSAAGYLGAAGWARHQFLRRR